MDRKILLFFKYYLPAILWMGVIFCISSVPDARIGSESLLWEILWRKAAHIGEYAVLAWLIFRIAYLGHRYERRDSFIVAVIAIGIFAVSDELHQSFVPGRTGKAIDVSVDILGGTIGLYLINFLYGAVFSVRRMLFVSILSIALVFSLVSVVQDGQRLADQKKLEEELQKKNNALEGSLTITIPPEDKEADVSENQADEEISETELTQKIQIDVPFTSQAPLANWDIFHEEACEEASIIMVKFFLDKKSFTSETADKEILNMIDFEMKNYGDYKDSTASQMVQLAKDFYGPLPENKKLKAIYDIKREDIKKYLARGNPIIVPAAGRLLGNPNFTHPGPLYHALVLVGYEGNEIITNDPGTRKGKNYRYNIDVLYNAIHDFPGNKDNIENGRKAMIVLE